MRTVFLLVLLVFFQAACAQVEPHIAENGFRFVSGDMQALFIQRLKNERVPFRVRDDGMVLYRSADEDAVSAIRLAMLRGSFVPSARFLDRTLEARFMQRLQEEKVEFGVQVRDGQRWITWSEKDDAKVQRIREALLQAR
jgi:hypothetical protein